jgi:glyoxylase-like metal-dependent hydrolase (beta-lactamase superfamily II)
MTAAWICMTCGVQYPPALSPPEHCAICEDDRQYVGLNGQAWTTLEALRETHHNDICAEEDGTWSIRTVPAFGIGQRAYLVATSEGNLLWDCVPLLDEATLDWVRRMGGVRAIAVSHPHYYATMVEWSEAFDDCPVWVHAADRRWVMRSAGAVSYWTGDTHMLFGELRLARCGGHFPGYQVLLWPQGYGGNGVLFAGDQPQVCMDRRWVTFMYSYPNWIPLDADTVNAITRVLDAMRFDRLYGAFGRNILEGAKATIARSRERYLTAIGAGRR